MPVGETDAGPNPGGCYYDGPNVNVGYVNPWPGSYESQAYSTVGWRTCRPAVLNDRRSANGELICGSSSRLRTREVVLVALASSPDCSTTLDCVLCNSL